jgi:Tol biopolymer transport system component
MKRTYLFRWHMLALALLLCGCSINISEPSQGTSTSLTLTASAPSSTALLQSSTPTPQSQVGDPSLPVLEIPVTWASLNLTGRLVYINGEVEGNSLVLSIRSLDLANGRIATIFTIPQGAWIYYVSISPDNKQLIMSYSPTPAENLPFYQALYTLPLDGSAPPQLLFTPPTKDDQYIQAEWSPDGRYIYYTHVNYQIPSDPTRIYPLYTIYRMAYPDGQPDMIAEKAYWPRLSPDSSRLVYVQVEPLSLNNKLYIADASGANAQEIVLSGDRIPDIKDAPLFSPDGQSILFSAASPVQAHQPDWSERLMGILVARADGIIPSEWWSVPMTGGQPTQLTHIQSLGLFASISPDGKYIASYSGDGIFVMNPDGSELTLLLPNSQGLSGTVSWIP